MSKNNTSDELENQIKYVLERLAEYLYSVKDENPIDTQVEDRAAIDNSVTEIMEWFTQKVTEAERRGRVEEHVRYVNIAHYTIHSDEDLARFVNEANSHLDSLQPNKKGVSDE